MLRMIESGPALRGLTDEQKEIYLAARDVAATDVTVRQLIAKLTKTRAEDEAIRERRIQLIRKIRAAFHEAVVEADPRVEEFLPEALPQRSESRERKSKD